MIFLVKDKSGAESVHEAMDKEEAIQRHLLHYSLIYLKDEPDVVEAPDETPCRDESCGTLTREQILR